MKLSTAMLQAVLAMYVVALPVGNGVGQALKRAGPVSDIDEATTIAVYGIKSKRDASAEGPVSDIDEATTIAVYGIKSKRDASPAGPVSDIDEATTIAVYGI